MATILAYTSPAVGHLFPQVPLLLELRDRGHTVHVRTISSQVDLLLGLGLEAEPIDARIEQIPLEDHRARSAKESLALSSAAFVRRGEIDSADFRAAHEAVLPDVSIVDVNTWGAAAVAESLGAPWVTFSPYTPPLDSPGRPAFGPGLAPMRGPLGRLRDAVVRRAVLGVVEKAQLRPLNPLRTRLGVSAVTTADELFRKAPLVLVATAKPFEYAVTDWVPDVVMVGDCAWEPPVEPPPWLDAIEDPIVLVTSSSESQDDTVLVRTALEALAGDPLHVVATMPAGVPETLDVPDNATVVDFVPHAPALERAAVAVTHGGMGSTQKALARGVPVCAVPFGRDQFEVARRVEVARAGTRLPAKRLDPARLRAAVLAAMEKRDGAERVAAGYRATGGAGAAADAVERLVRPADRAR